MVTEVGVVGGVGVVRAGGVVSGGCGNRAVKEIQMLRGKCLGGQ